MPADDPGPGGEGGEEGETADSAGSNVRFKVVPPPRDLEFLRAAHRAIPLVPGNVEDCCVRLMNGTDVASRDVAREYVAFLEALELIAETPHGYERRRVDVERDDVADAFDRRVFGAAELLDVLAVEGELTVDEAFDELREEVPDWERERHVDWEAEWRERTERLLEWAATFALVTNENGGYRLRESQ